MKMWTFVALIVIALEVVFLVSKFMVEKKEPVENVEDYIVNLAGDEVMKPSLVENGYKVATFSGGCFWCSEAEYENKEGVIEAVSGYSDGDKPNPTYEEVLTETTGYREAIQIVYDPKKTSYEELLDIYWKHIDPTDEGGQFADRGYSYTTAIYYHDEEQKELAEKSKKNYESLGRYSGPIVTKIIPFKNFYLAEEYHQDYSSKNPARYNLYKVGSGRDSYIKETWEN